jgi:hypothetical protein
MNDNTKHRIASGLLGIALSSLGTFASAGLTGWAFHVKTYGMMAPEMFGWIGAFILYGVVAIVAAAPALVTMLVFAIARCTPLGIHAVLSILLSLVLGSLALIMCFVTNPKDIGISGLVVAGVTCLLVVAVVETLMKKLLQNQSKHATSLPAPPHDG